MDINSVTSFFNRIDKCNVELKHVIPIKDGCRLLLIKQSQEYELNPNVILSFVTKQSGKQWRKTNVSSLVQAPSTG